MQCIKAHHLVHQEGGRRQAAHGGQDGHLAMCAAGRLKVHATMGVTLPQPVPGRLELAAEEEEGVAVE